MVKRVLMVAYHFPPMHGSSGVQRALRFAQHLPQHGWQPIILTVQPNAYAKTSDSQHAEVPANLVHRTLALDASRHMAVLGRYPSLLAQPDRWISWWLSAVPAGLRLIRRYQPDIIWSSYPIATAHLIGMTLHRMSGLPWIADQRDPLVDTDYPPDLRRRHIHGWIEQQAMQRAAAVVCTTRGAERDLRLRHPGVRAGKVEIIGNGYDEHSFQMAEISYQSRQHSTREARPFRLLHSGLIYPSERDPGMLFSALARLQADGCIDPGTFRLVLRASGHDDYLQGLIDQHALAGLVELAPALNYQDALAEMLDVDALLLLQASNCNGQIPAKLYEYLRARKPVLALTDPAGDTAAAMLEAGMDTIARLNSVEAIIGAVQRFLHLCRDDLAPRPSPDVVARHSRAARTGELANLLDRIYCKEPT